MSKKMKIIDLLNKIANGEEVPKKIKQKYLEGNSFEDLINNLNYFNKDFSKTLNEEIEVLYMNNIDILEELEEVHIVDGFVISNCLYHEIADTIETLIAENKELKEENEKMEELIENSECDMSTNYIRKSKVEELLKEIENRNYNDYTGCQDGNEVKYNILLELQSLLGKE